MFSLIAVLLMINVLINKWTNPALSRSAGSVCWGSMGSLVGSHMTGPCGSGRAERTCVEACVYTHSTVNKQWNKQTNSVINSTNYSHSSKSCRNKLQIKCLRRPIWKVLFYVKPILLLKKMLIFRVGKVSNYNCLKRILSTLFVFHYRTCTVQYNTKLI